jgi:hypothetical protein
MVVVFSALSRNQLNIYFFECYVAQNLWNIVSEIVGVKIGPDFESMARLWLSDTKYFFFCEWSDKKYKWTNVCIAAVLLSLWKIQNELCFQGVHWEGMAHQLQRCAGFLRNWSVLSDIDGAVKLQQWANEMERRSTSPPALPWRPHLRGSHSGSTGADGSVLESLSLSNQMRNNVISAPCMSGSALDHQANDDAVTVVLFQ